mgnify:FL=1
MRILLASASPRRRELLEQIGLPFEVVVSHVEEVITETEPGKVVEQLSSQKAEAVAGSLGGPGEETLVIGADTVVAAENTILGKPADAAKAVEMLRLLAGRTHAVYTGVTLILRGASGETARKTFHVRTDVSFYPMEEAEIRQYVATGDCMDKAGAYGIQGFCARYISGINGDYNNVVGLPVGRLYQEMKEWLDAREVSCI